MRKKNVSWMHYWPYWLYSVYIHIALFSGLYLISGKQNIKRTEQQERYITIKLSHEQIVFNKKVKLSEDTKSADPTKPLMHEYDSKKNVNIEDISEEISKSSHGIKESVDKIAESVDRIAEITVSLDNVVESLRSETDDFIKTLDIQFKKLEELLAFLKFFDGEGNLNDIFTHTYKMGERNEISYSEFFRSYANAYLLKKDRYGDILSILIENREIEYITDLEVIFENTGEFKFSKYEVNPKFKDRENRVFNHYKAIFDKMPRKFISPLECNLSAPYKSGYRLANREYARGESPSLEKLAK